MKFLVQPEANPNGKKCPLKDVCTLYVKPCPANVIYILPPMIR